jgi:ribonuclease D
MGIFGLSGSAASVNRCSGVLHINTSRRTGQKPYERLTTSTFYVISLVVILLGLGLVLLSAQTNWWTGKKPWEEFFSQVGTALIVAVGLAGVWELVGKRAFKREILETARTVTDIETAGLARVGTRIFDEVDWDEHFRMAKELDIYFAYGRTWRGLNRGRLRDMIRRGGRVRVYLPDPTDTTSIEQLSRRFANMQPANLIAAIDDARGDLEQLAKTGDVKVSYRSGDPVYSFYRFDSTFIVALYTHRPERQDVPMMVCTVGGTLYDFFERRNWKRSKTKVDLRRAPDGRLQVDSQAIPLLKGDIGEDLLEAYRAAGHVACDIETSGLNWRDARIGTCQLFAPEVGAAIVQTNGEVPQLLCRLLSDEAVLKVFHHAPFDMRFIGWHWKTSITRVACTKIASKILEPDLPKEQHSLQALLRRHLDIDISKEAERVSDWLAKDLTPAQVAYAATDVFYLLPLLQVLEKRLTGVDLHSLFERCLQHLPTRVELDLRGYGDVYLY